ncbi:hypothetical protein FSP39_015949 [Pinctada imbricata]|uniref:Uncharacterized protein n=1 Tax=Pinctada imbricata TaxID=66713 RepID=A0AA89CAY6_PINIB|nr:hypothetical protein FSP39_015949 [Pinctada imbricata]
MENPEMASESSESMENNSQPFYEEIEVKMINKRELGRLQLKFVGNEGVDTDGTKAMRRKLIQTCIDFLKEKAESVWKNAEMSIYDSEFNAIVLRSGTARYSFVCYADEFGEPKITDVSQRRCEIL